MRLHRRGYARPDVTVRVGGPSRCRLPVAGSGDEPTRAPTLNPRRSRRAWLTAIVGGALTASALSACVDEPTVDAGRSAVTVAGTHVAREDPASDGRTVIGVLLAQSGPLAAADARVLAGVQAEVASLQARGASSPGGPIELVVADTGSDLQVATEAAGRLLDRGADVLVVGCDPDVARNATRAAARSGRVVLAPCIGDAALGPDATGGVLFTFGPDDGAQGRILAEQAIASGLTTAATVSELTPADGTRQCRAFVARFQELGGRVVAEIEQPLGVGADVSASNLARLERPAVVVSCVTTGSVSVLVSSLRALDVQTAVLATASADGAGIIDPTVAYLTPAALRPPSPAVQALLDAGIPATSSVSVVSALALELLIAASNDAGTIAGDQVAAALRSPATAARADGLAFDDQQRLVLPLGLVPAG
jgi:ABC-type branched-subunit amino acid transport system substrate-binding protein